MNNIFIPGIKFINRFKYPQKFGLIAVLLFLFIPALMLGVAWNAGKDTAFTVIFPLFLVLLSLAYIFSCFVISTASKVPEAIEPETVEDTMKKIVVSAGKKFNADRCFFVEYDPKNNTYLPIKKHNTYISSLEIKDATGMQLYAEEMRPFTDYFIARQKALAVNDITRLEVPGKTRLLLEKCKIKSFMAVPLFYSSEFKGILAIEQVKEQRTYKNEEIELLEAIAGQASVLLNQSKLREQVIKLNEELKISLKTEKTIMKITSEASTLHNHEEIDNYLIKQIMSIFDVDKVLHLHVTENTLNWRVREIKGEPLEVFEGQCFIPVDAALEIIPPHENIIAINNTETDIKNEHLTHCLKKEGIKAFMAYPTSKKSPSYAEKSIIELTIISRSEQKEWLQEEKNLFKIIMDTISIVALEAIQRQELEETRKTFIATLAHDLKSPMLAEQKALEYFLSPEVKLKREDFCQYLADIYRTNKELLKLVDNLLAVYHYESGKVELDKTRENIGQVIRETVKSLKYLADERDCKILLDIQENLPPVDIDVTEINRVLTNLITNAIKHNPKNISIKTGAVKSDNHIQILINDNGRGMPKNIVNDIFRRYPLKKQRVGTGLGLYISKQIIDAHGGKIWFETEEGKGTTFYFTLPC